MENSCHTYHIVVVHLYRELKPEITQILECKQKFLSEQDFKLHFKLKHILQKQNDEDTSNPVKSGGFEKKIGDKSEEKIPPSNENDIKSK